jgi:hypothetical protein
MARCRTTAHASAGAASRRSRRGADAWADARAQDNPRGREPSTRDAAAAVTHGARLLVEPATLFGESVIDLEVGRCDGLRYDWRIRLRHRRLAVEHERVKPPGLGLVSPAVLRGDRTQHGGAGAAPAQGCGRARVALPGDQAGLTDRAGEPRRGGRRHRRDQRRGGLPQGRDLGGHVLKLAQEVRRADAVRDEAAAPA